MHWAIAIVQPRLCYSGYRWADRRLPTCESKKGWQFTLWNLKTLREEVHDFWAGTTLIRFNLTDHCCGATG